MLITGTLYQMESPDPVERKWSCVAVCNLINNDPSTRRLLQGKNIVGSLISRLSDSEEEVVVEAAGALRYATNHMYVTPMFSNYRMRLVIYASMEDTTYVVRCTTRISSRPCRPSFPR